MSSVRSAPTHGGLLFHSRNFLLQHPGKRGIMYSFFSLYPRERNRTLSASEDKKYVQMTQTPVWKLILKLAIPTTISMLITTIYNTADTFFVSRISVEASGATGIVFALMAILQAFGFMLGHGAGSNISRLLGARNNEHAGIFASTSFFLALAIGAVIGILGLCFLEPFMYLLGSTDTILADAKAYARFILIAGPAMTTSCVLNNILRYEGIAVYAMFGLTSGGILNMILDPIFIFGLNMGAGGAGLATAISQYISVTILLLPFLRGKTVTRISPRFITKQAKDLSNIVLTGLPSMLRQGLNSIATTLLNVQASVYGDAAIAAFSIVNRCTGLLFSLALGLAQGFQPVAAFNYGAKKHDRVRYAFFFTLISGISVMSVLCLLCGVNAPGVISLFRDDPEVLTTGSQALKFACIGQIFLPVSALGSMLFQSIGKKGSAAIVASLQSGAIFIPLLLTFPRLWGLTGLELAQPTAYMIAAIIVFPMVMRYFAKMRKAEEGTPLS